MNYQAHMKKVKQLKNILQSTSTGPHNPVNNLCAIDQLKVITWTISKTGTSALINAFQDCIAQRPHHVEPGVNWFQNVIHCHHETCWIGQISKDLAAIDFSFDLLVDYINHTGIKPLTIQCFRNPIDRIVSHFNHVLYNQKSHKDAKYCDFKNGINGDSEYLDYLKNTFDGIWTHDYDKDKKIGFHSGDKYDILYVSLEGINDLPKNIQSINELKEYHHIKIPKNKEQMNTNKKFGSDYSDFKKTIKLEKELIDKAFKINEEPLSFFYKDSEIKGMINDAHKKYKI